MSRKFLDDSISYKHFRPFLPKATDTAYDPGHQFQDYGDGTIFVNEGGRAGANFGHKYVNRNDLLEQFITFPSITLVTTALFNQSWNVYGTNSADAGTTFSTGGGVRISTTSLSGDQMILSPNTTAKQTAWFIGAQTQNRPIFETVITTITGAPAVTLMTIHAGLKLTNTNVSATDANQVFFRFQDVVNGGKFQAVVSSASVLTAIDTGVLVAINTTYHLKITVDSLLKPRFFINGVLVATGPILTTAITLLPYVGVTTNTAGPKQIDVRSVRVSKDLLD